MCFLLFFLVFLVGLVNNGIRNMRGVVDVRSMCVVHVCVCVFVYLCVCVYAPLYVCCAGVMISSHGFVLQQQASGLFLLFHLKGGSSGGLEHLPDALLGFGRALQVCECVDLLGHGSSLLRFNRFLFHFRQFLFECLRRKVISYNTLPSQLNRLVFYLYCVGIVSQIFLVAHQDNRHIRAEMFDLRKIYNIIC